MGLFVAMVVAYIPFLVMWVIPEAMKDMKKSKEEFERVKH